MNNLFASDPIGHTRVSARNILKHPHLKIEVLQGHRLRKDLLDETKKHQFPLNFMAYAHLVGLNMKEDSYGMHLFCPHLWAFSFERCSTRKLPGAWTPKMISLFESLEALAEKVGRLEDYQSGFRDSVAEWDTLAAASPLHAMLIRFLKCRAALKNSGQKHLK